jgi:hypothetical protein
MALKKKFQLLSALESSEGVAASLSATDASLVFDQEVQISTDILKRTPSGPSFSRAPDPVGRTTAQLSFKTDFRGSGDTTPSIDEPDWGRYVQASGMKKLTPRALTMSAPSVGTGLQLGEIMSQSSGTIRGVVVGLLQGGVPVHRLTGAGTAVVAPIAGTFTAASCSGESSGTTAACTANAAYAGLCYQPTSRKLFNMTTAAACAVALGEVVSIESGGIVVGSAQIIVNNGSFTNVDAVLLHGVVANGYTVRAAAGGTTTISAAPTQTETPSLTTRWNEDGEQNLLLGGRTDWTLGGSGGEPMQFNWTLRGAFGGAVDAVPIATSGLSTIVAPRLQGSLCCFGRGAEVYRLGTKEVQVARGAQIEDNIDANAASGISGSVVVDAEPSITCTVDRSHSTFPWQTLMQAGTLVRAAFMLGTTPGNIVGVIAPRCQITASQRADANGIMTWALTLNPKSIQESGDDDFYLVQL